MELVGDGGQSARLHLVRREIDVAATPDVRVRSQTTNRALLGQQAVDGGVDTVGCGRDEVSGGGLIEPGGRPRGLGQRRERADGLLARLEHLDPHGNGERPRGHVVRREDRRPGIRPHLGVALRPEHGQQEGPVGLGGGDDGRALGEMGVTHLQGSSRALDVDAVAQQEVHEPAGGHLVVLLRRNDEGVRWLARAALDRIPRHVVHVAEDRLAFVGAGLEVGPGRHQLVLDDVAQAPPAAFPG